MGKQVRVYDYTYAVPVNIVTGQIVNASTPKYFTGYPYLRGKKIKAISVMPVLLVAGAADIYLTLTNGKGQQLLYNYPISDLIVTAQGAVNNLRMRLFNLEDLDLDNSYYIQSTNVGYVNTGTLFIINFHY